jgi:hypothetical protein
MIMVLYQDKPYYVFHDYGNGMIEIRELNKSIGVVHLVKKEDVELIIKKEDAKY